MIICLVVTIGRLIFFCPKSNSYYIDSIQINRNTKSSAAWIKTLKDGQVIRFNNSILFEVKGRKIGWRHYTSFSVQEKALYQDKDNRLLLGLQKGKGIRRYQNIAAIRENKFEQFLEGISISDVYQDKSGGYWISSIEHGIFYCPDFDLKIYEESAGFPNKNITAFDFKDDNQIFVGFRNGQVGLLNHSNNQFELLPSFPKSDIIYDLFFDSTRQELWATTDGIPHFYSNEVWQPVFVRREYYHVFKRITKRSDFNFFWAAGLVGFFKLDLDRKKLSAPLASTADQKRTFRVWEDQQKRIWVGNVSGLFEFKNNQLIRPKPFHEVFETRVEDIGELSDGRLVLATKGEGVLIWSKDYFHQLTTRDGLTSDMLENIYVDEKDQIWAGTLEGLNKIVLQNDKFLIEKYTTFHGLPSNEITRVKSYKGQLWVATTKGLLQWKEKPRSSISSAPIIETFLVNNEPFDFGKNQTLPYDKNDVEINFLTINYLRNGKIPYRFRLNEGEWNHTNNRSVNFADLSPNDYIFEVQSQNEDEVWSDSRVIEFKIQPAFWQTRWFTFLWVSGLLGIIWLVYRNRLKQIQQATKVEKEMNELQRSALRAQMNPHFIFNCLNSIQNFIAQNDQANATRYLARFAQLVRGTLNASMEEKVSLKNEITLLENYLNLEKLRFKDQFDFSINVDKHLNLFETTIPPLLTQPFVENAILHGFAKMEKGGFIKIDFLKKNEKLEITIEDNGQGIFFSQQNKHASHAEHKGVGMSISQKRLELADELNEFEVKEIKNENGEVKGTLIKLVLEI